MWKFWLTNWMVSILMLLAMAALFSAWWRFEDYQKAQLRPDRLVHNLSEEVEALLKAGKDLEPFLLENDASELGTLYMIDSNGRDILDRELPNSLSKPVGAAPIGAPPQMPVLLTRTVVSGEGERYYLVFQIENRMTPFFYLFREFGIKVLFVVSLLATGLGAWFISRIVVKPLEQLVHPSQTAHPSDVLPRVNLNVLQRRDEIGDLARRLRSSSQEIERLIAVQHELVRDVSHEIRSPLARMHVASDLLAHDPANERALERLLREVRTIDALVEDLLRLSKLETSDAIQPFSTLDLSDVLNQCVSNARFEGATRGIVVNLISPRSYFVLGDQKLLESLFDNLIRNALRHTGPGTEIKILVMSSQDLWHISVCDQGPGVPADRLTNIFDPFVRVDSSRSPGTGGHGLGLAIARKIVLLHQGDITARNRQSRGLEISVTLPKASNIDLIHADKISRTDASHDISI